MITKEEVVLSVEKNGSSLMRWIKSVVTGIHLHLCVLLIQVYAVKVQVNGILLLVGSTL